MKRLYAGYQDRVSFRTIHVNLHGATNSEIRNFVQDNDIRYPVGIDQSDNVWKVFSFTHLPHGLLVDENGTVRWSGSLFTHNLEKVFTDFYGKPQALDDDNGTESDVPVNAPDGPVGMQCSGGACKLPARK